MATGRNMPVQTQITLERVYCVVKPTTVNSPPPPKSENLRSNESHPQLTSTGNQCKITVIEEAQTTHNYPG